MQRKVQRYREGERSFIWTMGRVEQQSLSNRTFRGVETQERLPEIREKCKHNLQHPVFQNRRKQP